MHDTKEKKGYLKNIINPRVGFVVYNKIYQDFINAIAKSDVERVKLHITANPKIVGIIDNLGSSMGIKYNTPLIWAIACSTPEISNIILDTTVAQGYDLDYRNDLSGKQFSNTALTLAIKKGDLELASKLLDAGADPNKTSRLGDFTPLHLLSFRASLEVANNADTARLNLYKEVFSKFLNHKDINLELVDKFGNQPCELFYSTINPSKDLFFYKDIITGKILSEWEFRTRYNLDSPTPQNNKFVSYINKDDTTLASALNESFSYFTDGFVELVENRAKHQADIENFYIELINDSNERIAAIHEVTCYKDEAREQDENEYGGENLIDQFSMDSLLGLQKDLE
jgi:hypothetical protein